MYGQCKLSIRACPYTEWMKTPIRSIRIDDQLWAQATSVAAKQGQSVSQAIRQHLEQMTLCDNACGPGIGHTTHTAQPGGGVSATSVT